MGRNLAMHVQTAFLLSTAGSMILSVLERNLGWRLMTDNRVTLYRAVFGKLLGIAELLSGLIGHKSSFVKVER